MLADQDDVWYPNKIEETFLKMQELQALSSLHPRPALVFTDMHVVNKHLQILERSFVQMQNLQGLLKPTFVQLLTQNVAAGCL